MRENEIRMKLKRKNKHSKEVDKKGNPQKDTYGYLLAYTQGDNVHIGLFYQSTRNSKADMIKIAYGRAEKCFDRGITIPQSILKDFKKFYEMCINRRSFNGKFIMSDFWIYDSEIDDLALVDINDL